MAAARRGRTSRLEAPEGLPGFESWRGLKSIGVAISEAVNATARRSR